MEQNRDYFVFFRSFWNEILALVNEKEQYLFLMAMLRYAFEGVEPSMERGINLAYWRHLKFDIDREMDNCNSKKNQKKQKEKEKGEDIDRDKEKDKEKDLDKDKDENYFFKEKKEKFFEEVFSFTDYPRHHLQTFVDYYAQPLQSQPHKMLYEKYDTWNLKAALAKWKAPAEPPATKTTIVLKSAEQRAADRRAEADEERQRILGIVQAWRNNPHGPRAFLVKEWEKNGTLARLGIDIHQSP